MNSIERQTMDQKPLWMNSIDEMDDKEFQQWSALLRQRTGMEVKPERKSFLTTGIRLRMRELNFTRYSEYYLYLLSGRTGNVEWATLVDRLTIHETRFFRHPGSVELLTEQFLPKYLAAQHGKNNIQAWSVGCATGEESYTLAIALDDYFLKRYPDFYYGVVGSDISLPALAKAKKGIYDARRLKNMPTSYLNTYLTELDDGQYQIKPALNSRVCFNMFNLLETKYSAIHQMDIIFCQNVLIYFDTNLRHIILDKLVEHLAPGGLLTIGVGEALNWKHPKMKRLNSHDTLAFTKESDDGKE